MPATYEKIQSTTLGSAAASIDFTSIAATYTDLKIVLVATSSVNGRNLYLRFNSDSGTNYSNTYLVGDGATAISGKTTSAAQINCTGGTVAISSTVPHLFAIDIFSYAGSTNKTALISTSQDRNGTGSVGNVIGLWRSTSAITAVNLLPQSDNFAIGTTATLYGILKA
jgi:hypothetical protein